LPWCLVFVQKVNFREKHQKRSQTSYFTRRLTEPEGEAEMGHEWPKPHGGAAWGPTAPATEEGDSDTSPSPPFDYLTLSDLKREGVVHFIQKHHRTPPPSRNLFRGPETPFWHSAGTGNWRRSSPSSSPTLLHRPSMFPPSMCE
jgi:hypothetical protein